MTRQFNLPAMGAELRGWGWPGALGGLCLLLALWVWAVALPSQEQAAAAARDEAQAARRQAWRAVQAQARQAEQPQALPAEAFVNVFPAPADRQVRVAALWSLAQQHGLQWPRSEFNATDEADLPLQRLRLSVNLSGPYLAWRGFLTDALQGDEALSLDSLRIERADLAQAEVQVQAQFSFWMRRP